jgi:hypothetical protein
MDRPQLSWNSCIRLLLPILVVVIPDSGVARCHKEPSELAGVCYPVEGTGYVVPCMDGIPIPVGPLSPLVEGDSLVVETGRVTFMDFRSGETLVHAAGSRVVVQKVEREKRPTWWDNLKEQIASSLNGLEEDRTGGSVRKGMPFFWPDSNRFAPGVPIPFEWANVPAVSALRIFSGADTIEIDVSRESPEHGIHVWKPPADSPPGHLRWTVLDEEGVPLGGGRLAILTPEVAEAERQRLLAEAEAEVGPALQMFAARVFAEAEGAYLW